MKKKIQKLFAAVLALCMTLAPVSAYADEVSNPAPITITSGLLLEEEIAEATFDESRMIYGEALPDTCITVWVSGMEEEDVPVENYYEEFQVGSLGIFSVLLPLEMGDNYITLQVDCDGYDASWYTTEIRRMPLSVKEELKRMIALPGKVGILGES